MIEQLSYRHAHLKELELMYDYVLIFDTGFITNLD